MGRYPKIKPELFDIIRNSAETVKIYDLPIPFPFIIHIRPTSTEDTVACLVNHTQPIIIPAPYSEKNKIIRKMKKDGVYIVKAEPMHYRTSELCPKCENKGIPSFQLKSNDSSYTRSGKYSDKEPEQIKIKGKRDYWLTFKHGKERCWVQQWQGNTEGTFKSKTKIENIHPKKFMIGYAFRQLHERSKADKTL